MGASQQRITAIDHAARNIRVGAMIKARPDLSYTDIGRVFGISASVVARIATQLGVQRPRGPIDASKCHTPQVNARRANGYGQSCYRRRIAPRCWLCTILLETVDEGIALSRIGKKTRTICQTCVESYQIEVAEWLREAKAKPCHMGEAK